MHTSWPAGVAAKVLYIYRSTDAAFTCIQKRSYGIELSVFYHQNYRGRREHLRQYGVVESVGKVFGLHPRCLGLNVLVAAGKAANLVGERPMSSIARFRTGSISDARGGNKSRCART